VIEISGYRILRQLGRGGMATVYLAVQESVEREVALKVMSPALLVDPDFGERFLREAKIAAKLLHRHVVGIHDVGRVGDLNYIAMEYLSGGAVLPKDGSACDPAFALRVVREIAGALDYAHRSGFVHRDVKPDNILLRADGSTALTDFGIARALDSTGRMTRTGAVVGTPHYMSPEQARGKQIDGRADLYSLGIVLHEMLTGRVPYSADDSLAVGIMHITQPVPVLPADLERLQPLLARMLAKQPEDRFQSGDELAAAVAEVERGSASGTPGPSAHARLSEAAPDQAAVTRVDNAVAPSAYERSEPSLGRIEGIVAALDDGAKRGARPATRERRRRGSGALPLAAAALLAIVGAALWHYQDAIRGLLPRTGFNDTLSRAQDALAAGNLTSVRGDGARELFLAARAQDPDNDAARRGLEEVGRRLLEQADAELRRDDVASARASIERARELLGGGTAVDALEVRLKDREAQADETAGLLEQAQAALDAGRIVGADGAAALYQRVLEGDAGHALAAAGLRRSADALVVQARSALAAGDVATAVARADDVARVSPTHPDLPTLLGEIAQAKEAERSALDAVVDQADQRLRAGAISGAPDSALELYRSVLAKQPDHARAKEGLVGVARAFVVRANAAIEEGDPAAAARALESAAALAPDLPDLRASRVQLRELRERIAIDAQRPVLTAESAARVRELVADAARAVAAGHLITPPGESAYDKYRAALAIDGTDAQARDGLAALPARARTLFDAAMADAAVSRALTLLDAVRQVAPDDPAIPAMTQRLANAFLDQADLRLGEGRREDAARAIEQARRLAPDNPRLTGLAERLQAMNSASG